MGEKVRSILSRRWQAALCGGLLLTHVPACRQSPIQRDPSLSRVPITPFRELEGGYTVQAPDVLSLKVEGKPELTGRLTVQNDGKVDLTPSIRLEVDGKTIPEISKRIADNFDVAIEAVDLAVAEHKSQVVFLEGEVEGSARAVPYHGPETLVSFLKRTGGLTPGADSEHILLRRANAADGKAPETKEINLNRHLKNNTEANEVRIHPYDQVVVEPSRKSILIECLPPWLTGVKRKTPPQEPDPSTVAGPLAAGP